MSVLLPKRLFPEERRSLLHCRAVQLTLKIKQGFRRAMVKTMARAAKVPHFYFVKEVNWDELVDIRSSFQENIKHTFLLVLIKSLSMALTKYPLHEQLLQRGVYRIDPQRFP